MATVTLAASTSMPENPMFMTEQGGRTMGIDVGSCNVRAGIWSFWAHTPLVVPTSHGTFAIPAAATVRHPTFDVDRMQNILRSLRDDAATFLMGECPTKAVLAVPDTCTDADKTALKSAAESAGLDVVRFVRQPVAVAMAYAGAGLVGPGDVVVVDVGGGALHVAVVAIRDDGDVAVKAATSDDRLGGAAFDAAMHAFVLRQLGDGSRPSVAAAWQREKHVLFDGDGGGGGGGGPEYVAVEHVRITRATFERVCTELLRCTVEAVGKCLAAAGTPKFGVGKVLLAGGGARIPKIRELLARYFDGGADVCAIADPENAAVYGATVQGALLAGEKLLVGPRRRTPETLGLAIDGDRMVPVIQRNRALPVEEHVAVRTIRDGQRKMALEFYEGDSPRVLDNRLVAVIGLGGLPARPGGQVQVHVCMRVDEHGNLTVSAHNEELAISENLTRQLYVDDAVLAMYDDGGGGKTGTERPSNAEWWATSSSLGEAFEAAEWRSAMQEYVESMKKKVAEAAGAGVVKPDYLRRVEACLEEAETWLAAQGGVAAGRHEVKAQLEHVLHVCSKLDSTQKLGLHSSSSSSSSSSSNKGSSSRSRKLWYRSLRGLLFYVPPY